MTDDSHQPDQSDAMTLAQRVAAAMSGDEDLLATVRDLLMARLAEDQLTPDERAEAERLLAQISGGTDLIQ